MEGPPSCERSWGGKEYGTHFLEWGKELHAGSCGPGEKKKFTNHREGASWKAQYARSPAVLHYGKGGDSESSVLDKRKERSLALSGTPQGENLKGYLLTSLEKVGENRPEYNGRLLH